MSAVLTPPGRLTAGPAGEDVEVTVVMPCLNEARTVGRCVGKAQGAFERARVRGEVVVADNGSTDGSPLIAEAEGARVISVDRRGYGSAVQAGIEAAHGRYIIMGDADDSYDFESLGPFIDRLRSGDDLVMGNRFRGGIRPGAMPWLHRYIGNPALTGILNLFFHSPIGDAHCGLRGFRKDAYESLGATSPGMEFASEIVVKACLHRLKISEVPTVLRPDGRDRPPHLRSFRDGWRHLRLLLMFCPLWLYLIPSALLASLGLGLMVWLTPGPRPLAGVVLDVHTMLFGSLCVILASQTLWLWAFSKVHGWSSGSHPPDASSSRVFRHFNLERGLVAGAALTLAGLGLLGLLTRGWWAGGFRALDLQSTLRTALWGFTAMVLGVQAVSGSFFLSMLGMSPRSRPPVTGTHARPAGARP